MSMVSLEQPRLEHLLAITRDLSATISLEQLLHKIVQVAAELTETEGGSILLYDEPSGELRFMATTHPAVKLVSIPVPIDSSFAGAAFTSRTPVMVPVVGDDPRYYRGIDVAVGFKARSVLVVPLQFQDRCLGVVEVVNKCNGLTFDQQDTDTLQVLAAQAAIAIQNAQLYQQAQLEIAERAQAEAEVRRHRDHLEELVDERVAEIKRINLELQQQNAELDAFAHTVAHDLKNPLGPLMGFAHILLEELHDNPNEVAQDCATHLLASSRKMSRIVDELLLLASVRRQDEVRLEQLDMAVIVREVQERLNYLAQQHGAEISVPLTWPTAVGHSAWIEEVWANYLSNAIKYGGRPPRLELGATVLDDEKLARFWVRDNGVGLTPEEQARLFTEFTQLHQLRAQGHGLGLSIVRRIIERLGGQVGVESAPDHGSVFFFTLPLVTAQSSSPTTTA
jgi:signal transduction histidine kinase